MNHGGLFLSCKRSLWAHPAAGRLGFIIDQKIQVCVWSGWLPSTGLNGRLMGRRSEPDGLWGALFSLPPPVIHHISSWYWEIACPTLVEGWPGEQTGGWGGSASWLEMATGTWLLHIIRSLVFSSHSHSQMEARDCLLGSGWYLRACSNHKYSQKTVDNQSAPTSIQSTSN